MSFISAPLWISAALACTDDQRLLELGKVLRATRRGLEPRVLRAGELLARFAQDRLQAHDVGRQHFGGRDEARQLERALHRLHLRPDRRADRHEVEHFAAQPVGDLRAAFGHAADLQVDARGELLHAEAGIEAALDQRLRSMRADRPPERAQAALRRDVLDAGDRVAHRRRRPPRRRAARREGRAGTGGAA